MTTARLETVLNFRDVGASVADSSRISPGRLFRSAHLDNVSKKDATYLHTTLGIATLIDLRVTQELFIQEVSNGLTVYRPKYRDGLSTTRILTVTKHQRPLMGPAFWKEQERKLPWAQKAKVTLWRWGNSEPAVCHSLVNAASKKWNRFHAASDILDFSQPCVKAIFDALTLEESYPVLIYDYKGGDSVGLIIMIILSILGVEKERIVQDYVASDEDSDRLFAEMTDTKTRIGSSVEIPPVEYRPAFVDEIFRHIDVKYGGCAAYLRVIGLTRTDVDKIRRLLGPSSFEKSKILDV